MNKKANRKNIYNIKAECLHKRTLKLIALWMLTIVIAFASLSISSRSFANEDSINGEAYHETFDDEEVTTQEVLMKDMCVDQIGKCLDEPGTKKRIIDKMVVEKGCWKYGYVKTCNKISSKNDCKKIDLEKFNLTKDECLTNTKLGERSFCLNLKKTFTHIYKVSETVYNSELVIDPDNKEVVKDLLCGALCLDGNCSSVFKDVQGVNNEMGKSIAQLEMLSQIKKGMIDHNTLKFDIFSATPRRCHNKTRVHSNCCNESGWFKSAGLVKCSPEVKVLASESRKGRCEYIGKYCAKKVLGVCIRETKSYCCFPTILAKTIHRGARDQLGKTLGSAKYPRCGGLTLEEIEKIDFSLIDFKEFFNSEVKPMMKNYSTKDNENLIKRSFPNGVQSTTQSAQPNYGSSSFTDNNHQGTNYKLFEESEGEGR